MTTFSQIYEATYRWYWEEVSRLAEEALKLREVDAALPDVEERLLEWVESTVDIHEYVSYTGRNYLVLLASENDTSYIDNVGHGEISLRGQAYWAMREDVIETIARKQESRV